MAKLPPQHVTLTCPVCGAPIQAEVYNLIDVGLDPELKGKLLRGRINVAHCNNCGSEGVIAAPLLYHDPEKELLLAFIPPETGLNDQDQQRVIGNLTNAIMAYLPPEQRKGYLLVPKVFLSYQRLLEEILKGEGVTPEMMSDQRERMDLLDRLWTAQEKGEDLAAQVAEVDERLDFEFFAVLGAYIESSRQDGQEARARSLEGLRERLLELSSYGQKLAAEMVAGQGEQPALSREELLDKLLAAGSEEELTNLVVWYRSAVDYAFYQLLTGRIETAEREGRPEEVQRLSDLRSVLLEVTERLDAETEAALQNAGNTLRRLLDAPEPEAFIREHLADFDDAFFVVLGANLQAARAANREDARERLQELGNLVLSIAQEKLPPEVRLVRQLLAAPDDTAATALLQENRAQVDDKLVELMRDLSDELEDKETAERLQQLAGMAEEQLHG